MAWERTAEFWQERDAWVAALRAEQAKQVAAGTRQLPTLDRRMNYWKVYSRKLASVNPSARGRVSFETDPGLVKALQTLIADTAPSLMRAFDHHLAPVVASAFHQWPVASGYSKASVFLGYEQTSETEFSAVLGCKAPYTIYIKGSPAHKLIRLPALAAANRIVEDLDLGRQ